MEKNELEYLVSELGVEYFQEDKSGFTATNKARIEGKNDIKKEEMPPKINMIGVNYGTAIQDSVLRDSEITHKHTISPNTNESITSPKSWYVTPFFKYFLWPVLAAVFAGFILWVIFKK